jgi:hypothetical protein
MPEPHFDIRCRERGIRSVEPAVLRLAIERAVRANDESVIEYVMHRLGNPIWRFKLPVEGILYVVTYRDTGRCVTILTQAMIRDYKATDRHMRKTKRFKRRAMSDV